MQLNFRGDHKMEILDNKKNNKVGIKLKEDIKTDTKLSVISSYFTIYAYKSLREELKKIKKLRLLFSEPTFIENKKDIKREFNLNGSYEKGIAGDRYELKLKGELTQTEIARECADWLMEKVEVRAYDGEYSIPQKMFIIENENSKEENSYITGSSDFTSSGLGFVPSEKPEINQYVKNYNFTQQLITQFDYFWNDKEKVQDVKTTLLNTLECVYKENSAEFMYYVTLYNIFKDYLNGMTEKDIIKSRIGFKDTVVWNKLYQFQKDGVLGAIDKLEKYNGCIMLD